MAVLSHLKVQLKLTDGKVIGFDTGSYNSCINSFTQLFQADILVEDATIHRPVSLQGVSRAQQIFMWADAEIEVKLIPYGSNLASTPVGITLYPQVPSVLSVQNIVEIYVSNSTGQQGRIIIQGAGI